MKNKFLIATFFGILLLFSVNVKAANFTDNQTVDKNKTWTVRFTGEIVYDDLTKEGITVTDSKGNIVKVGLQLGQDNKAVIATAPQGGYIPGESYILKVGTKVHSNKGKLLKSETNLHFDIKSDEAKTLNSKFETKIKSGNLSVDYTIDQALSDIDKFGLNTLNIPVAIKIDNLTSSDMTVDEPSKEKAISLIKELSGRNINIILEPYPWINGGDSSETEWTPDNMNTFFSNWKTNVLKPLIDDIGNPYDVQALYVGSNFEKIEAEEKDWCSTIDYVKTYYKGLVTYRTNWWAKASWDPTSKTHYESKLNNKLFSKLDFISIAAYFELTNNPTNTVENLVSAIEKSQISVEGLIRNQNIKDEIKEFNNTWEKPIFFGELGFPKISGAATHPWDPYQNNTINNVEQANCFEAYRREFENEPWLLGFSIFAIGENSNEKGKEKRYYPSEESMQVIKNWYSK